MFEHVGAARYDEFFRTVEKLLKPDGVMLLHSIGPVGTAGRHKSVDIQIHFPRRLYPGAV
jgi:cyclopropane-fatty-acyl-phospholipid synthase